MSSLQRKRNIALIVPTLSQSVEYSFTLGVRDGLPEDEYNILYIASGWIEDEEEDSGLAAKLHKIISFADLDGVIIYGAGIANRVTPEAVKVITDCYPGIPIVNVGNVLDGFPSVIVDNRNPFKAFVSHLYEQKNCRSIAFLGGPEDNYDAIERRAAFRSAMQQYGLELPESLDWKGHFSIGSGSFAVANYLEKFTQLPDAVVCANDLSAIGVVNELLSHGIRIPEDIKVVGFDDLEYSKLVQVPLSTGRYPIFNMGGCAAKTMTDWLNGQTPDLKIVAESSVIFRQSTGDYGSPESQLYEQINLKYHYFSRDSNADRLKISRAVNRSDSLITVLSNAVTSIHDIGVRQLYFFQQNEADDGYGSILSLFNDKVELLPDNHSLYKPLVLQDIIKSNSLEDVNWLIAPVATDQVFFGFLLLAVLPSESDFVEYLSNEIARKFENQRFAVHSEELKKQMVKAEQMASLGRLVSGLAHEINTPLGVSLMAATNLNEEINGIRSQLDKNNITLSGFKNFLDTCDETYQILYSSLRRSVDLVSSFKQVSVDRHVEELRFVNLAEYIKEILVSLRPKIKQSKVKVTTELDENIVIKTHAGTWAQVLTNLVLNSITHGFDGGSHDGNIFVMLFQTDNEIILKVIDDGKGIPKEKVKLVFDPFYTTARGQGGTGLGLHIVYNMVTQKLLGRISVDSTCGKNEDQGTAFTVAIPLDGK